MINKNFYRKTNDKKILHKVGKQWKVISVALLMAIAGGAVATHAANADANNGINDQPYAANQAQFKQPVQHNKTVQSASSEGIHYYPEASGAAASYFDKVNSDNDVAAKNFNTVNSYVQSLNNQYGPQVHSYSASSASASSAESNDTKLASSYSAVNQNPNTAKTINSLAAKNSMDPSVYENYVENTEQTYSGEVQSASADVKAASDVSSLVNKLENTNLATASLNATTAYGVAQSNLAAAKDIQASVYARYNVNGGDYSTWLNIADKLSAGARILDAEGNPSGYQAALNNLTNTQIVNGASQAAARNAVNKAVNLDVKSAISTFKASSANTNDLTDFAEDIDNGSALVNSGDSALTAANPSNPDLLAGGGSEEAYTSAVSAAVAEQFAGTVRAAANSLYGKYNPESLTASARSSVASSAENSANDRVATMTNLANIASANSSVVSTVSASVADMDQATSSDDAAAYAASLLNNNDDNQDPLGNLESALGIEETKPNDFGPAINTLSTYVSALSNSVTSGGVANASAASLVNDIESTNAFNFQANSTTANSVASAASSTASLASSYASLFTSLNNDKAIPTGSIFNASYDNVIKGNQQDRSLNGSSLNNLLAYADYTSTTKADPYTLNALYNVVNDTNTGNNSTDSSSTSLSLTAVANDFNNIYTELKSDAKDATKVARTDGNGFKTNTYHNIVPFNTDDATDTATANTVKAALLSDGIDIDALNSEAGAISDVNSAASSAVSSSAAVKGFNPNSYATNLSDALNDAGNSAINVENSYASSSEAFSAANDEDVTLASYYASSYSDAANSESAVYSNVSSALNSFFRSAANDPVFNSADTAYADAEAAAAADKEMGVEYSKVVFNNSPHYLDVLKGAKLHSSYDYGSQYDKVLGSVNKGDRLTVLGVNFSRVGNWRGQTRYLVYDNNTKQKGFFTGQPQYSKAAYLNSKFDTNNVDVSVKILKPVNVMDNLNGGKVVKTLNPGAIVDGVTVVNDNPNNDAMGFTKIETSDYNFFTANTDYVAINNVVAKNNNNNNNNNSNFNFNLDNVDLAHAYNNNSQL